VILEDIPWWVETKKGQKKNCTNEEEIGHAKH
jgi:hypothetical protein